MDTNNKANFIKNSTENKIEWTQKMDENMEIWPINERQKKVIDKLEEMLNFFKSTQIKNEDDLDIIERPLDDLQSSLKYIPIEPYFDILPSEIKTDILSYLCDSNAFTAASVCLEWKQILKSRFKEKAVTIGERCCDFKCCSYYDECLIPEEMLKASAVHRLNVHLSISQSVAVCELDSKLVTDGLTSASSFSLIGDCTCSYQNSSESDSTHSWSDSTEDECEVNPLSIDQLEDLFKGLEEKDEIMEKVKLVNLDLTELNQDRLVYCFVNKIKNLTLHESADWTRHSKMFNFDKLIRKLSEESSEFKLNHLTIAKLEYPDELALELADALCSVEYVMLQGNFPLKLETLKQLLENILTDTRQVKIKAFITRKRFDFCSLIKPEDLKKLYTKMTTLRLEGTFTEDQVEAAKSLPDVKVRGRLRTVIEKDF